VCFFPTVKTRILNFSGPSTALQRLSSIFSFSLKFINTPFGFQWGGLMRGLKAISLSPITPIDPADFPPNLSDCPLLTWRRSPIQVEVIESVGHPVGLCRETPKWLRSRENRNSPLCEPVVVHLPHAPPDRFSRILSHTQTPSGLFCRKRLPPAFGRYVLGCYVKHGVFSDDPVNLLADRDRSLRITTTTKKPDWIVQSTSGERISFLQMCWLFAMPE
jgi:hypothetical protein